MDERISQKGEIDLRKQIYIKDGNGDTLQRRITVVNGSPVLHFVSFAGIDERLKALKEAKERPDDVWLLSYPKSGVHWMYEAIGILISGKLEPLQNSKEKTFFEGANFDDLGKLHDQRVISTHIRPKYIPEGKLAKEKLVFIMRNPKSVAVSYFHLSLNVKNHEYSGTFDGFLELFINGADDLFGSWFEYTTEWLEVLKNRDNVLVLYYEELKKDCVSNLQKICTFLGLSRDEEFCQKTAELCSFDTMKSNKGKNTESLQKQQKMLKAGTSFMRKGQIDDWKNYFTVKQSEDFDKLFDEKMKNFPEITTRLQYE